MAVSKPRMFSKQSDDNKSCYYAQAWRHDSQRDKRQAQQWQEMKTIAGHRWLQPRKNRRISIATSRRGQQWVVVALLAKATFSLYVGRIMLYGRILARNILIGVRLFIAESNQQTALGGGNICFFVYKSMT